MTLFRQKKKKRGEKAINRVRVLFGLARAFVPERKRERLRGREIGVG